MRTTSCAARGRPLAALLFSLLAILVLSSAAVAAPAIELRQEIDIDDLYVVGSAEGPTRAHLALTLEGVGPDGGYPVDCALVIDTSATADLMNGKAFAFDLIDAFGDDDRIAVVSYATAPQLDVSLTTNRPDLKTAIGDLAVGGKSALGQAMQMARRELLANGREDAIAVEILLSDGQNNVGIEPDVEGEIAAESGIQIVSVGIGSLINRSLLEDFASETDGLFFARPSRQALTEIIDHLVSNTAATDIRLEKRLPEGLRLISARPAPSQVVTLSDGTTSAIWQVSELLLGQEITIDMEIEALERGAWETDVDSIVTFADFRGIEGSVNVPSLTVYASEPNRLPVARFTVEPERGATTLDTVSFTDLSYDQEEDGRIVAWEWDFGDGSMASEPNPRHRYRDSGLYTVRVRVVDDRGGRSDEAIAQVRIDEPPGPAAAFEIAPAAPTTADTVSFRDRSFAQIDGTEIVAWSWDFDDGSSSIERNPEHRFPQQGTYTVRLTVTDSHGTTSQAYAFDVQIVNTPPIAGFSTRGAMVGDMDADAVSAADQPRVGMEIFLDASGSYDLDNTIAWYMWDFDGDGVVDRTTETSEVAYTFTEPGEQRVILTVVDTEGAQATVEKTLNVIAAVAATRSINTGLPDDWTLPSGTVHVTLNLSVNTTVNGLSISETIPAGWTFAAVENDGATLREDGLTKEWLFLEKFVPDGVNSKREIRYTLTAPDTVSEILQAEISGVIGSSSPRVAQGLAKEDRVTATSILALPVVISRWNVESGTVDPFLGETITFDQVQYAVSLWVSGGPVPHTGDLTITLATMQDLIAYWLTGNSVHDPLP